MRGPPEEIPAQESRQLGLDEEKFRNNLALVITLSDHFRQVPSFATSLVHYALGLPWRQAFCYNGYVRNYQLPCS